jgi:DUF1009 family protein
VLEDKLLRMNDAGKVIEPISREEEEENEDESLLRQIGQSLFATGPDVMSAHEHNKVLSSASNLLSKIQNGS